MGSRIIFDCWSDDRVHGLNARLLESIGRRLFHPFPYKTDPEKLKTDLIYLGYSNVVITPLTNLVEEYYKRSFYDEYKSSWLSVEALV